MYDSETKRKGKRVLALLLAISLFFSVVAVMYISVTPQETTEPYTEFYILGSNGSAGGYPTDLTVNESGELIVGITNNEYKEMTYTVAVINDETVIEDRTVEIGNGKTWEDDVVFKFEEEGEHEVEILLFVGEEIGSFDDPYQDLRLRVSVE